MYSVLIGGGPFAEFYSGLAQLLVRLFGIALAVTLVATIIQIFFSDDKESGKKLARWVVVCAVGLTIFKVLG